MLKYIVVATAFLGVGLGTPLKNPTSRIIGGSTADITSYPYALQLEYLENELVCGAVLVSSNWALTTATCVYDKYQNSFQVRAGSTTLGTGGQTFEVIEFVYPPQLNISYNDYNAALLHLSDSVPENLAQTITMAAADSSIPEGDTLTVPGWGLEGASDDEFPGSLKVMQLPILTYDECHNAYSSGNALDVTDSMFCAGYLNSDGGQAFCYGDIGGPAVADGVLMGLTSWSYSCSEVGVFTKVSSVRSWIDSIIYS